MLEKSRSTNSKRPEELRREDKVHHLKTRMKFENWENGYVQDFEDHILTLSTNKEYHGKTIKANYEDFITFFKSALP